MVDQHDRSSQQCHDDSSSNGIGSYGVENALGFVGGHGSFRFDAVSLQGQEGIAAPLVPAVRASHAHRLCQGVISVQIVVCISGLASGTAVASEAEHSGSDGAPLCLSQGDGAEVKGQDVGAGHGLVCG